MLNFNSKTKGFTLVEIMVALAIFAMVVVVALGAVLTIVDANRKAQALHNVIGNLNLSLESMSRDLRTGYDYECLPDALCSDDSINTEIKFTSEQERDRLGGDPQPVFVTYSLKSNAGKGYIEKKINGVNVPPPGTITDDVTGVNVNIEHLSFTGFNFGNSVEQPTILVRVKGKVDAYGQETNFSLQTMVSQRLLDFDF